ncbi:MAG: OmpA family protein [Chthoniobacterales bacterium]
MSATADDYELFDDEPTGFARWILPALLMSVLVHLSFYLWAKTYPVEPFSESYYEEMVPLKFQLERVEIDPELLQPVLDEKTAAAASPTAVTLPEETISFEKMMGDLTATPAAPDIDNPLLAETPKVESVTLANTVESAEKSGAQSVVRDLDALREEFIIDQPDVSGRPLLEMTNPGIASGAVRVPDGASAGSSTPGFSNLDDLLADTGPLTNETAPILMPADLLYDYNSFELQSSALSSLRKLGELIQRNTEASFVIEGHTDSFGSDAYNRTLSDKRAEKVKTWLVQRMGIDPTRIETRGYGASRLIAPSSGSIDDQQINRRVEIVIRAAQ